MANIWNQISAINSKMRPDNWFKSGGNNPAISAAAIQAASMIPMQGVKIPTLEDITNREYGIIDYEPVNEFEALDYNINPNELYQATNFNPNKINYMGDVNLSQMSPTELRNILSDPDVLATQKNTLQGFNDITQSGGLTDIDRARLAEIQNQINNQNKANQESILLSNRQRNMGNSGGELASQLLNQQASANQQNQMGLDINAQAQARALQALSMGGDYANQLDNQQFSQQAQKLQAQDMINQFNTQNTNEGFLRNANLRQQLEGQNVGIRNEGDFYNAQNIQAIQNQNADKYGMQNQYNTQNRQNTSNQNVNLRNQAALMNTQNRQSIKNENVDLWNQANMYNKTQKPMNQYGMESGNAQAISNSISNYAQMQAQKDAAKIQAQAQKEAAAISAAGNVAMGGATIYSGAGKTGKS